MPDHHPFDPPSEPSESSPLPPPPGFATSTSYGASGPIGPRQGGPGRGKIAVIALAAAGLTGGAIFGISQFADAEDPMLESSPMTTLARASGGPGSENVGGGATPIGTLPDGTPDLSQLPNIMDDLTECLDLDEWFGSAGAVDMGELGRLGPPATGSLPSLDFAGGGDTVTITDSDGVTIYRLGDGDGSIAISKSEGEITVAASGDVTESTFDFAELEGVVDEMFGDLEQLDLEGMDLENLDIDELLEGLDLEHMLEEMDVEASDLPSISMPPGFDPADITACLDQVGLPSSGG